MPGPRHYFRKADTVRSFNQHPVAGFYLQLAGIGPCGAVPLSQFNSYNSCHTLLFSVDPRLPALRGS
jgi:hypothetical protein